MKKPKDKKKGDHGRHIRFPDDLDSWLGKRAPAAGLKTVPRLVVFVMNRYRELVENGKDLAA
jgi:hypothetical protein